MGVERLAIEDNDTEDLLRLSSVNHWARFAHKLNCTQIPHSVDTILQIFTSVYSYARMHRQVVQTIPSQKHKCDQAWPEQDSPGILQNSLQPNNTVTHGIHTSQDTSY